ncbi:endolytic transglycosylase MltG [Selenomonas sp. TAMA-11512]|uniref:endolytic transglycosylase MltG n=1 Tax=Selenomonas sp. TAMA-11512 TaxID=3095337 RepID=UPI00308A3ACE|nr:endolytic transglycosylase MltG [Selenomonas sp. TAMA-11512]
MKLLKDFEPFSSIWKQLKNTLKGNALQDGINDFFANPSLETLHLRDKWQWWVGILLLLLLLCSLPFVVLSMAGTTTRVNAGTPIYFEVHPGMTANEIAASLEDKGIIESRFKFWWVVKLNDASEQFKVGTYAFSAGMEPKEVIRELMQGETVTIQFVIPEGFTVDDIAKRLDAQGIVKQEDFLREAKSYRPFDYVDPPSNVRYDAEGFLFPDTYIIGGDTGVKEILDIMSKDFDQRLTLEMRHRAKEKNLSIYELITLASLVEKEARYDEDRPIIAQVFLKRLEIGMPLQSDATLQYLMDAPKEDVLISDTKIDSPYNTYQNAGLPPGPVANPGLDSIEAVLEPSDTEYLYFVADRDGHNYYSYTYSEHLATVDQVR